MNPRRHSIAATVPEEKATRPRRHSIGAINHQTINAALQEANKEMPAQKRLASGVHKSKQFRDILHACRFDTVFLFDCDNTLARPKSAFDLASDQWFVALYIAAGEFLKDADKTRASVLEVYEAALQLVDAKPVEAASIEIIKRLKEIGFPMYVITARGPNLVDVTERHLQQVGFPLSNNEPRILLPTNVAGRQPVFQNNVIYCDGTPKSECLTALAAIKGISLKHGVMVDDSAKHTGDLEKMFKKLGEDNYVGIHYTHLEERVKRFKMEHAAVKLSEVHSLFSPEVQKTIEVLAPVLGLKK